MSEPSLLHVVRLMRAAAANVVELSDALLYAPKSERSRASLRLPNALYWLQETINRVLVALTQEGRP